MSIWHVYNVVQLDDATVIERILETVEGEPGPAVIAECYPGYTIRIVEQPERRATTYRRRKSK